MDIMAGAHPPLRSGFVSKRALLGAVVVLAAALMPASAAALDLPVVPAAVTEAVAPLAEPVADVVAPVTDPVAEAAAPVVEPVEAAVAPVAEPVAEAVAPVVEPVAEAAAPAAEAAAPVAEPVAEAVAPVVEAAAPVVEAAADAVSPVVDAVEPVVTAVSEAAEPIAATVEPVLAPVANVVSATADDVLTPPAETTGAAAGLPAQTSDEEAEQVAAPAGGRADGGDHPTAPQSGGHGPVATNEPIDVAPPVTPPVASSSDGPAMFPATAADAVPAPASAEETPATTLDVPGALPIASVPTEVDMPRSSAAGPEVRGSPPYAGAGGGGPPEVSPNARTLLLAMTGLALLALAGVASAVASGLSPPTASNVLAALSAPLRLVGPELGRILRPATVLVRPQRLAFELERPG